MSTRARRCAAMFVALVSVGVARAEERAAIDPAWLDKARTEIKAVWEKYEALSLHLEEEGEIRSDKVPGSTGTLAVFRPQTRRERKVRLGDNVILEQVRILDDQPNKPQIRLECDNSDYAFTLGKSQEDSPYALVEYAPGKRKLPLVRRGFAFVDFAFQSLHDALGAIENDGQHTLRALRFDETRGLLRIEFENVTQGITSQRALFLDPGQGWRVVEGRSESSYLVGTTRWTYGAVVGGIEFPTESKGLTTHKPGREHPPDFETTGRLIRLQLTDKTPADFRLSAFGFPEPVDVAPPPKPTPWYLWLLAAAGACAALSFSFAYLRRRQRGHAARPVPGGNP
jgi:hypothetical protein